MKKIFDRFIYLVDGVALALCAVVLVDFLLHPLEGDSTFDSVLFRAVSILLLMPLTLLVGFLVIRRVPGNIVGPLLIGWAGTVAFFSIREGIGTPLIAIFTYYDIAFGWLCLFLMVLHFPDGQIFPPGAARWIYSLLGIMLIWNGLLFLSTAILPVPSQPPNPFYLPALESTSKLIGGIGLLFLTVIMVMTVLLPVLRYRSGGVRERLQIRWLALTAGGIVLYTLVVLIVYPLLTGGEPMSNGDNIATVLFYISVGLFPPVTIGVAVLRYHLWDIEIIIRRTLVYSILTVSLTLVFFGIVALLQGLSALLFSQDRSPLVTMFSTLATAALFTPLRRRIQTFIDRRFYRQRYDPEQVLAAMSRSLREEVTLDHLTGLLLEIVGETLQPAQVSLWMKDSHAPRAPGGSSSTDHRDGNHDG